MPSLPPPPSPNAAGSASRAGPDAPHGSLERRLPLLISALLASAVGVFGVAAYRAVHGASVERATGRLSGVAQQLATMSSTTNASRAAALRALATDSVTMASRARLAERLADAQQAGDSMLVGLELWTPDGRRTLRVGTATAPRDSAVLAATVDGAARDDSVRRSPLYHVAGRVGVWTVVPVRRGGRTTGFLAEGRRLAASPRTEQSIRELTGEDVAVLVTSRRSADWATIGGEPRTAPFALPASASPTAPHAAVVRDARGRRFYVAQAAVAQTPWLIVLAEPESAVLRRPHEFLRTLLGVGALVLVAGAGGAWLLGRHVTRPLVAMTGAADALARGDYAQRVAVVGDTELARLAATFNSMAAGVGEAHAALAERNLGLQRANAAKAQFLAMMSHELRTPLNAIGGYTELMALGIRGPVTDQQLEDLSRIRRSKDHLLSIINDLLSFARADAGHLTLTLAPVAVPEVLADVEALLGPQFAAKGVRLRVEPAPPAATVRADREKLQQVVLNLLTNALRFTAPGGHVTVACALGSATRPTARRDADVVRLAVHDTGVGIPADRLEAIFEPFVQIDAGLTRQVGGTGLGLAIVRTLVGAMGGTVAVESTVGAGSTFTVTLPRAAMAHAVATPAAPAPLASSGGAG